jgi:hypothetical protein
VKTVVVLALGVLLATAMPAAARRGRSADTLQLVDAFLKGPWVGVVCPPGTPAAGGDEVVCWTIKNAGVVRGLGAAGESGVLVIDAPHTACAVWHSTSVLTIAGKGTIELSASTPSGTCDNEAVTINLNATEAFTVTGGTGAYAGASGSGTVSTSGVAQGAGGNAFAGTIVAPSTNFDLTPPVIGGASAKVVRAPRGKRAVRVWFAVSAQDAVDGPVHSACVPASGSSFPIGRTRVTCTATDSSANNATAGFTVTVKR